MASRRVVLTRSPGFVGIKEGATTQQPWPLLVRERESQSPQGPASETTEEMRAFGRHLPHELSDVTLSWTDVAEGDDFGVVFLGDVGHGDRLFLDIPSEGKRARLVHG